MTSRMGVRYIDQAGMLTIEGALLFAQFDAAVAKLAAISALVAPSGGATIDAQARAAIAAIIAA